MGDRSLVLYRTVGLGMTAFSRLRFDVHVEGRLTLAPGTLYVVTHRSNLDTPLLCGAVFPKINRAGRDLPWFVVRDDLLLAGFPAHVVPGRLPLRLGIGRILERSLRCLALRPATRMRVVELARDDPTLPLEALPNAAAFALRADSKGWRRPQLVRDVLRSGNADLLWQMVERDEAPEPASAWTQRLADAKRDLERVVGLMRSGESILLSPEGTPSRDGSVGPLQRGVGLLVRRGRPRRVVPIGLAYDPLGRGRMRGHVRIGEPVDPPTRDVEEALHVLLRRTLPHTDGAARAYAYRHGPAGVPPPGPPELLDRLCREYESAIV
ncbi:MAG TPA: hypothetical protein VFA97_03885 [Gaiellaceae bacterium]|nr:hypothetical protein [Gaiellaceae bacterium]